MAERGIAKLRRMKKIWKVLSQRLARNEVRRQNLRRAMAYLKRALEQSTQAELFAPTEDERVSLQVDIEYLEKRMVTIAKQLKNVRTDTKKRTARFDAFNRKLLGLVNELARLKVIRVNSFEEIKDVAWLRDKFHFGGTVAVLRDWNAQRKSKLRLRAHRLGFHCLTL